MKWTDKRPEYTPIEVGGIYPGYQFMYIGLFMIDPISPGEWVDLS